MRPPLFRLQTYLLASVLLMLLFLVSGCGTTAGVKSPEETSFVLVSQTKAGGVLRMIQGEAVTCKLVEHNHGENDTAHEVVFEDGSCKVISVK